MPSSGTTPRIQRTESEIMTLYPQVPKKSISPSMWKTIGVATTLLALVAFNGYFSRSSKNLLFTQRSLRGDDESNGRRRLATPYNTTVTALPAWASNMANVWESAAGTTPFFWYIPKGGGSTIVKVFSYCLGLVLASNRGRYTSNTTLQVYEVGNPTKYPSIPKYVNVLTHTENWIDESASRGLVPSGIADVITSQFLVKSMETLFSAANKARVVVMFRQPTKRIVDQFYYRQHATWESTWDEELASMSLDDFALSDKMVENFEVKSLNSISDDTEITEEHVTVAKEIVRQKFLVMIMEWYDVSVVRMEKYFGWWTDLDVMENYTINNCHYDFVTHGDHYGKHPLVPHSEQTLNTITTRNWADVELYHYAKNIFADQEKLVP